MLISAVILTKNEEANIAACIDTVQWCNEIIVIDDNSTDKTVLLAKQKGAKVIPHTLENDFANQRNFGIDEAKGDWVFFVDADEQVSKKLVREIQEKICGNDERKAFLVKREDYVWNKKLVHGETGNMWLVRLAQKGSGKWKGNVHEVWEVNGETENLENPLLHFPHPDIKSFLEEINFYTTLRANELYVRRKKIHLFSILSFPAGKFLVTYVLKRGYRDGTAGFLVAMMMSFHSFLVRAKLWQLWQKTS
ncbi:MAG TPA: glycosyltransferase family 2 protein [Patescibacteria group bacterium]|nr:glycosyltransferase family 2 protein [Patescibacteria group bacterium]